VDEKPLTRHVLNEEHVYKTFGMKGIGISNSSAVNSMKLLKLSPQQNFSSYFVT
jgi:hypothetical protein